MLSHSALVVGSSDCNTMPLHGAPWPSCGDTSNYALAAASVRGSIALTQSARHAAEESQTFDVEGHLSCP